MEEAVLQTKFAHFEKPQIIVGTQDDVIDLIGRKALDFFRNPLPVLDEADEMLSMGSKDDLKLF